MEYILFGMSYGRGVGMAPGWTRTRCGARGCRKHLQLRNRSQNGATPESGSPVLHLGNPQLSQRSRP